MTANDKNEIIEQLLNEPCWVIDLLPWQVPQNTGGQFFEIERYYLEQPQYERLCQQFADVLLKLNCYHDLEVNCSTLTEWVKNPKPTILVEWLTACMKNGHFYALIENEQALITASGGDTHMTLYNPSPTLLELITQLASAAGLFVWQPRWKQ